VNAGKVDPKSWYADAEGEGSRFVGEGGHFIDTVSWWMGTEPTEVTTARTPDDADNLIVTLRYPDGSTGVVTYATGGDPRYPKELLEVFGQGAVAKLDNFARSEIWRGGKPKSQRSIGTIDKGQRNELASFIDAVKTGGPMPISLSSLLATTYATIAASRPSSEKQSQRVVANVRDLRSVVAPVAPLESLDPEPLDPEPV